MDINTKGFNPNYIILYLKCLCVNFFYHNQELDKVLPVIKPNLDLFEKSSTSTEIRHMWIGHASSLIQMEGLTFLTDPMFSSRCSPFQSIGRRRYRPPPCSIEELPPIDFVIISHDHYDHLDYNTVCALNKRFVIKYDRLLKS